jgi:hypothetical protein
MKGREQLGDLGIDGIIILKSTMKESAAKMLV